MIGSRRRAISVTACGAGLQRRGRPGVVVGDAQQDLAAVEPGVGDARRVVGGHPVVQLPARALQPAAVHRAEGELAVERAEERQLLQHVGAAEHAVDAGVGEGHEQPVEQAAAIGHRERVVTDAEHPPCGVVGGDDEQPAVGQQRPPRAVAAGAARRRRDRSPAARATRPSGHRPTVRLALSRGQVGDLRRGRHVVRAHQPAGDDRARGVAVLGRPLQRPAGEQPVAEGPTEGIAGAEPADDVDREGRRPAATLGGGHEDAVGAELDERGSHAAPEQAVGGVVRVGGTDGDLALGAVADDDRRVLEGDRQLAGGARRAVPHRRPPVEVEHDVPAPVAGSQQPVHRGPARLGGQGAGRHPQDRHLGRHLDVDIVQRQLEIRRSAPR